MTETNWNADRYFSPDPAQQRLARELYQSVAALPLVCPHGHVDARLFADPNYHFANPAEPTLSVRLQEMFGLSETPRVGSARVPLTIHLLSPARRPVQVTRDLASFWANGYKSVKSELKGRYPRHYWPDDPLIAEPTARVRHPRPR